MELECNMQVCWSRLGTCPQPRARLSPISHQAQGPTLCPCPRTHLVCEIASCQVQVLKLATATLVISTGQIQQAPRNVLQAPRKSVPAKR